MYHHRNAFSTQILSKTYSRIKLAQSNIHRQSPQPRPLSSFCKNDILYNQTLIAKNKKLSIMIKTVHSYMVSLEELDWIMNQTQSVMRQYIKITVEKFGQSHKLQIQNLYAQLTKLIQRFSGIDKKSLLQLTIPLKQPKKLKKSENINLLNLKKTQTIDSFKYLQTQNQQQILQQLQTTDFSKIKLPSLIKQSPIQYNTNHYIKQYHQLSNQYQNKISQYQSTINIIKQQLDKQKYHLNVITKQFQSQICHLNQKISTYHKEWESYKIFATSCIRKCKTNLSQLSKFYPQSTEGVQNILDQFFTWQHKLDIQLFESPISQLDNLKHKKIQQLVQIQNQLKYKKQQLDKLQTQRTNINTSNHTNHISNNHINNKNCTNDLVTILVQQALSIENLINQINEI